MPTALRNVNAAAIVAPISLARAGKLGLPEVPHVSVFRQANRHEPDCHRFNR
jgi:hypothetical protein